MPNLESSIASPALDFSEDDLMRLLSKVDPRAYLKPSYVGKRYPHIAAIPGRDDILLRWTTRMSGVFPDFPSQSELAEHLDTYERLLGSLAASENIIVPVHSSFPLARCPRLGRPVIYTAVEHVSTQPLEHCGNPEIIAKTGHTLLKEARKPAPHIWDNTKIEQWGYDSTSETAVALDLDTFVTTDPRRATPGLIVWGRGIAEHDGGELYKQAKELHAAASNAFGARQG